jgi:uncharacterized protein (DUF779 family)
LASSDLGTPAEQAIAPEVTPEASVRAENHPTVPGPGLAAPQVDFTQAAVDLLVRLRERHGDLMFHQSGGCCDGSSPMCYPAGDLLLSDADVLLGTLTLPADAGGHEAEVEFWMTHEQFAYWRHTFLTVDVVSGRGAGFSVEAPEGKRFLIRSRLMEG